MKCAKCGKPMWVYFIRHNFPWQKHATEKWCPLCAGLSLMFKENEMRNHKYRAWDKELHIMSLPIEPFKNGQLFFFFPGIGARAGNHEQLIIEQFTGKRDKNGKGKECYENDLMQLTHDNIDDCCLTRIVMSEKGQWSLEYEGRIIASLWDGIYQHNGEVIRTIHDTPEAKT